MKVLQKQSIKLHALVIFPFWAGDLKLYPKEVIEKALNDGLRYIEDEKMIANIKTCLAFLVAFIDDEEANKRNGKLLNSKGFQEAVKRRLGKNDKL